MLGRVGAQQTFVESISKPPVSPKNTLSINPAAAGCHTEIEEEGKSKSHRRALSS